METAVKTGVVRASFAHVFEPYAGNEGAEPKYSIMALIDKNDKKTIKAINQAIEAAKEIGKDKCWGGKIPKNLKLPLRDADEEKDTDDHPEYEGMMFFNASSKRKPGVINRNRETLINDDEFWSGCYCKLSVNLYPYSVSGSNGIAVGLNNILLWEEGERFGGGRASAESDFADDFDEDDDDDLM